MTLHDIFSRLQCAVMLLCIELRDLYLSKFECTYLYLVHDPTIWRMKIRLNKKLIKAKFPSSTLKV